MTVKNCSGNQRRRHTALKRQRLSLTPWPVSSMQDATTALEASLASVREWGGGDEAIDNRDLSTVAVKKHTSAEKSNTAWKRLLERLEAFLCMWEHAGPDCVRLYRP